MQDQEKPYIGDTEDQNEFGLPESHYEPIERDEENEPAVFDTPTYYEDEEDEEESSKTGLIIGSIIGVVVIAAAVVYLFFFDGIDQVSAMFGEKQPEPVVQEQKAVPEPEPVYEEPVVEDTYEEPVVETPAVNPLAPFQDISTLSGPTGMSYIVVGSFVDQDMASDMAQKLLKQGTGSKIIPPSKRSPLQYRVTVAEFATFQDAMQQIEQFRGQYGANAWVLKY